MVPGLVGTTVIAWVTSPTVVVWSVLYPLQVQGMPGLELVVPGGRPLLHLGRGRVRLALLQEHIPFVELSLLALRPGFRPFLFRGHALQVRQGDMERLPYLTACFFFFGLIILAFSLARLWRHSIYPFPVYLDGVLFFFFFNFIILYSAVLGHDSLNTHSLS